MVNLFLHISLAFKIWIQFFVSRHSQENILSRIPLSHYGGDPSKILWIKFKKANGFRTIPSFSISISIALVLTNLHMTINFKTPFQTHRTRNSKLILFQSVKIVQSASCSVFSQPTVLKCQITSLELISL